MTTVVVEYPGYGVNTGECTISKIFETAEAALNYFQTARYESTPLFV